MAWEAPFAVLMRYPPWRVMTPRALRICRHREGDVVGSCCAVEPNGDIVEQSRSKGDKCSEMFQPRGKKLVMHTDVFHIRLPCLPLHLLREGQRWCEWQKQWLPWLHQIWSGLLSPALQLGWWGQICQPSRLPTVWRGRRGSSEGGVRREGGRRECHSSLQSPLLHFSAVPGP